MKKINVLILAIILTISLFTVIMCSNAIVIRTGDFVEFTYLVPDGMITDPNEKEAMIKAKIENLEATNEIYWNDLPSDPDTLAKAFQQIWRFILTRYPAFKGIAKSEDNPDGIDWQEIGREGYEDMQNLDHYGQFARQVTQLGWQLKEGHTNIATRRMTGALRRTPFRKVYPVLNTGTMSRIGACYAVTEKEELVVTKITSESNPYNLKPGDEVVGFNGIPWNDWLPRLIDSEIPIYGSPASSEPAIRYNLLRSGMTNANLFEKINIKRYGSDEVETMDIVFMPFDIGDYDVCADYMGDVEGIDRPKMGAKWDTTTYGKVNIDGQKIGYMYITECPAGFEDFDSVFDWDPYKTEWAKEFNRIIMELSEDTDGIILDLRFNVGGRYETFYLGLSKLVDDNEDRRMFRFVKRYEKNPDVLALTIDKDKGEKFIADPKHSYKKPVVVLTGPNCISACDFLMAFFSKYPEDFKIIGKAHNGSFTGLYGFDYDMGAGDVMYQYIPFVAGVYYTDKEPKDEKEIVDYDLLIRRNFTQEEVWQTKDSIAKGVDRVRQRAVEIIKAGK